jgi:hypothetical protein
MFSGLRCFHYRLRWFATGRPSSRLWLGAVVLAPAAFAGATYASVTVVTHASASANSNLVASWPFTGNARDASGNGNDGIMVGATRTADRFGVPNHAV